MNYYIEVKSFVGDSCGRDPVKEAVSKATEQANDYIQFLDDNDDDPYDIISTTTHIIGHGDYFSYVITMTVKRYLSTDEEGKK